MTNSRAVGTQPICRTTRLCDRRSEKHSRSGIRVCASIEPVPARFGCLRCNASLLSVQEQRQVRMATIDINRLSAQERLERLEQLWDSLSSTPEALPLTATQREERDRRLDDAYLWYERQRPGLGEEFLVAVDARPSVGRRESNQVSRHSSEHATRSDSQVSFNNPDLLGDLCAPLKGYCEESSVANWC